MSIIKKSVLFFLFYAITTNGLSACLLCTCDISAEPMTFGNYNPISGAPQTTSSQVSVTCSTASIVAIGASYTITLSTGASSNYAQRTMSDGSDTLNYNIYTASDYNAIWGDGSSGTSTISDSYSLIQLFPVTRQYPAYGLIPGGQNVTPGSYNDTITATVTY